MTFRSLPEVLEKTAAGASSDTGYMFLDEAGSTYVSFAQVYEQAVALAGALQAVGVKKGDCVPLDIPTSATFASLYWGILLAGAAPCVLPGVEAAQSREEALRRVTAVATQVSASLAIVARKDPYEPLEFTAGVRVLVPRDIEDTSSRWQPPELALGDLAIVQASSGTTGLPKCVALTHGNVLSNLRQISARLGARADDVLISWLPMYHDLGLIGCFLWPLYNGIRTVLMPPSRFLRRPLTWLQAINDHRGTISPAPNFAYALVRNRVADTELAALDLSSWRAALCGAEQVDVANLQQFSKRFAVCGFRASAPTAAYGMAEAVLGAAIGRPEDPLRYERIVRSALAETGRAVPKQGESDDDTVTVCGCGRALDETEIEVHGEDGTALPDGHVGEIWLRSPSVTPGYIGDHERTAETFRDGWLLSGDLGYLREGTLFVTGRRKEVIVIRGHNYSPTDFEWAAAEVRGVRGGRVIAFGAYSDEDATERVHIVFERSEDSDVSDDEIEARVRTHVARRTGQMPVVRVVPRNAIPRTTSGKLQRTAVRALFAAKRRAA